MFDSLQKCVVAATQVRQTQNSFKKFFGTVRKKLEVSTMILWELGELQSYTIYHDSSEICQVGSSRDAGKKISARIL